MDFRKFVNPLFRGRPNVDRAFCQLFKKGRLSLPTLLPSRLFRSFDEQTVELRDLPKGQWSTPLADVILLLKIVRCSRPSRLLEVGSYRGYTALLLAKHMREDAHLVTVDQDERHGEAYRGTEYANRIERRVGTTGEGVIEGDEQYDFIFLDAGHKYHEVKHDTELLLPLLSSQGYMLWHDYANWGFLRQLNGVPEYLNALSKKRPIAQISGTDLAIHSPAWAESESEVFEEAVVSHEGTPWTTQKLRG